MDYLQDFLDFTQYVRGRSASTIQSYRYDLSQFLEWVKGKELDPLKIRPVDIDEFFIWLRKERKNIASSINRKRSGLIGLYRWFQRKELIVKSPMEYVSLMKEPKNLPKYLTPQEQEALILAAQNGNGAKRFITSYTKERTYLLILLLLDCGLRIGEACSLKVEDINFDDGTLKVNGKGDKERMAILSDRLTIALREYLERVSVIDLEKKVRPGIPARGFKLAQIAQESGIPFGTVIELAVAKRYESQGKRSRELQSFINEKVKPLPLQYVLFNRGGGALNTRQAFRIIRDIGIRAGIKNLYPHLLRHSFAVNLRRKGADTMLLKEALGHSSILTTQIYCGFTDGEFKEKMRQLVN